MARGKAMGGVLGGSVVLAGAVANARRRRRTRATAGAEPPLPPPLPPGRLVCVPGRGEMMVRDSGPGGRSAVLLLHGWTATADVNFFAVYGPLAQDRRVIALDHRGHGRGIRAGTFSLEDCADDAAGLLDELGVARAVAVGYSMGGPVAMLLARRHPQKVSGLVVQATALEWSGEWSERVRWRGLALLELSLRMGSGESFVTRLLDDAVRRNPAVAAIRSWLAGEFRRGDPGSIADAGRAISSYDARGWVRSLDVPAAAVVTTEDDLVPPAKQRALAEALSARVFELDAGHDAPVVAGEAFARATCAAVAWVEQAAEERLAAHSAAR